MARKPLTSSEQLVGRRLPPLPKHIDTVMSRFIGQDGEFKRQFSPSPQESYLRPAFNAARKKGWIRCTNEGWSFQGSKPDYLWELTERGMEESKAAAKRVEDTNTARADWSRDWRKAWEAARKAKEQPSAQPEAPISVPS